VAAVVVVAIFSRDDDDPENALVPMAVAECPLPARPIWFLGELVSTPPTGGVGESFEQVPVGGTPDPVAAREVESTIANFIECSNAGDVLRWLSLYSDDYLRRVFDPEDELDAETADRLIESIATPEAVPADKAVTLIGLHEKVALPDGRVAVVLETDGGDPNPEGTDLNLFVLKRSGDGWVIDDAVNDIDESEAAMSERNQ